MSFTIYIHIKLLFASFFPYHDEKWTKLFSLNRECYLATIILKVYM